MKRTHIMSVSLSLVILFMAGVMYAQTETDYKSKIESLNREMAQNMVSGQTEKSLSLYTSDAISLPSNEPMRQGLDAIRKADEDMTKSGWKCNSFEPTTLKVIPSGNLITEIGTYRISMSMAGSNKPMDDHGKYVTIWEKQKDGSLKVKVETWNSDVDQSEMMKTAQQSTPDKLAPEQK